MRKKSVSVSLPPDMLAHYKDLAETAGISISRLIYLRLKSRKKSIVIVGRDLLGVVGKLNRRFRLSVSMIFIFKSTFLLCDRHP